MLKTLTGFVIGGIYASTWWLAFEIKADGIEAPVIILSIVLAIFSAFYCADHWYDKE